jgi:predicted permease
MKRFFRLPWRKEHHIAADVDAELRFHIEERTARLVSLGNSPDAARAQAMREFGDVDEARRSIANLDRQTERETQRREFLGDLVQDAGYALRSLRNAPTFAIAVLLTLAVGIGANTAVFNLINAVLIKPPAMGEVSDVAWITPMNIGGNSGGWTMPDVIAFRSQSRSWSHVSATGNVSLTLNSGDPERLDGLAVNGGYFDVMGIRPSPGRGFLAYEDSAAAPVMSIVISHALWQARFGGDSSVVGSVVRINTEAMTIVGIAPEGFNGIRIGDQLDFWLPFPALTRLHVGHDGLYQAHRSRWLRMNARLARGVTIAEALAEAAVIESRLEPHITKAADRRTLTVASVRGGVDPQARARMLPVLSLVMLVPVLVLCVACANVANLFVSRSVLRQRELAVRRALGASRGRIVRQLLTECAILGVTAGALGVAVSYGLTAVVSRVAAMPQDVISILAPDWRVFAMTFGLALAAGALFGLLPALSATRASITPALKNDGITAQVGRGRHRLRNAFVISQVALSLSLLITAGLFVGSLRKALDVDPGYDATNMIAATFDLSGQGYAADRLRRFDAELAERATALPTVAAAAVVEVLPLSGSSSSTQLRKEGTALDAPGQFTFTNRVTAGYFAAMKIPIVRGRGFGPGDNASSPKVMVMNEQLASLLWPGEEAIGKRVRSPHADTALVEVIGIARNGKYRTLAEPVQQPAYWLSSAQFPMGTRATLVVRSRTNLGDAVIAARTALREMDATLPVSRVQSLESYIVETINGQRAGAALLAVFGGLALALAAFGIFGVIAQGVAARRREIGIRMSLGARASDVVRSFVREGLVLTAIGSVVGVVLSLALSKLLASLLFGLKPTDVLTFAGASAAIILVAAVASFVPARRAASVDPLIALRSD